MMAGGTAAAVKASQQATKPQPTWYGGDPEAYAGYRDRYGAARTAGAAVGDQGMKSLAELADAGQGVATQGQGIVTDALGRRFDPNFGAQEVAHGIGDRAVAEANLASQAALDQATHKNVAIAQSGGPAAMRMAMAENADAGIVGAQNAATTAAGARLAGEQAYLGQLNLGDQFVTAQRQQALTEAGLGAGLVGTGFGAQATGGGGVMQGGLLRERSYLEGETGVEQTQTMLALDEERRRQADKQRKNQNLWGLGAGLISGGGQVMAGAGGGK